MGYEETIARLVEMESRYDDGFSSADRALLDRLHQDLFGKAITNRGCSSCYRDAYILITIKLKKDKAMPKKPNYVLKAGVIIHPFGTSKFHANPITDDVAEDYLSNYPDRIIDFASYPTDWEERCAAFVHAKAEAEAAAEKARAEELARVPESTDQTELQKQVEELLEAEKAAKEAIEDLTKKAAEADTLSSENEELKAQIAELTEELNQTLVIINGADENAPGDDAEAAQQMELETLKADLTAAQEEIATLKSENRALKAANTRLKNNASKEVEAETLPDEEPKAE